VHSVYDGIWFFGPFVEPPLADVWRLAFLVTALVLVYLWHWRTGRQPITAR
jgi:hypothetical protein